jgi:hypothetical protein
MNIRTDADAELDRLPFVEYARITAERGATQFGNPDKPKLTFDELVASGMTFAEIEAEYGEETAINAGIARDPDNPELTAKDFAVMRPAIEVDPDLVEAYLSGNLKMPSGERVSPVPRRQTADR